MIIRHVTVQSFKLIFFWRFQILFLDYLFWKILYKSKDGMGELGTYQICEMGSEIMERIGLVMYGEINKRVEHWILRSM